MEAGRTL